MTNFIEMHQTIVPGTRMVRGSRWPATCSLDRRCYEAVSQSGAPHALARVLVAAGVADQPVRVTCDAISGTEIRRLPGHVSYPSLHEMAGYTIRESATAPVQRVRWTDPPLHWAAPQEDTSGAKMGVNAAPYDDNGTMPSGVVTARPCAPQAMFAATDTHPPERPPEGKVSSGAS